MMFLLFANKICDGNRQLAVNDDFGFEIINAVDTEDEGFELIDSNTKESYYRQTIGQKISNGIKNGLINSRLVRSNSQDALNKIFNAGLKPDQKQELDEGTYTLIDKVIDENGVESVVCVDINARGSLKAADILRRLLPKIAEKKARELAPKTSHSRISSWTSWATKSVTNRFVSAKKETVTEEEVAFLVAYMDSVLEQAKNVIIHTMNEMIEEALTKVTDKTTQFIGNMAMTAAINAAVMKAVPGLSIFQATSLSAYLPGFATNFMPKAAIDAMAPCAGPSTFIKGFIEGVTEETKFYEKISEAVNKGRRAATDYVKEGLLYSVNESCDNAKKLIMEKLEASFSGFYNAESDKTKGIAAAEEALKNFLGENSRHLKAYDFTKYIAKRDAPVSRFVKKATCVAECVAEATAHRLAENVSGRFNYRTRLTSWGKTVGRGSVNAVRSAANYTKSAVSDYSRDALGLLIALNNNSI